MLTAGCRLQGHRQQEDRQQAGRQQQGRQQGEMQGWNRSDLSSGREGAQALVQLLQLLLELLQGHGRLSSSGVPAGTGHRLVHNLLLHHMEAAL